MKYPWMPLFWGDFLANTMDLSAQEAGAYLFLIAHAWEHSGEIPSEPVRQARIAHVRHDQWKKVWAVLENFFETTRDGQAIDRPIHRRVTDELQRLGKISRNRKEAAVQMHSKSYAHAANGGRKPKPKNKNGISRQGMSPDRGDDYRSPPRAKSDNVLEPIPDRPQAKSNPKLETLKQKARSKGKKHDERDQNEEMQQVRR